ncbi:thiamine phosphate synthase [Desmospora profundinema]|uniref:Thiamine-phosphate synthase n=1 Tax=Desmospora profundinema TaxID=1571184 RepID=A0ABU1IP87_9BACL|nr:thiamine phosphate synthase [Desmospora profundinema]MDR6226536.1 thiamine-phosphate pyrophosphorylase [Desmospora profundinema]
MPFSPFSLRLYFIMGSQDCDGRDPTWVLKEAIAGGITLFQFREKESSLTMTETVFLGKRLREICQRSSIPFIVNDRADLAMVLEADGVHVGQEDLPAVQARRLMGTDAIIGVSCEQPGEVDKAIQAGADYIGVGSLFSTRSKADAGKPIGPEAIHRIRQSHAHGLPIVGIGGIHSDNADSVVSAGADGVAVISAIASAPSPRQAAEDLCMAMDQRNRKTV